MRHIGAHLERDDGEEIPEEQRTGIAHEDPGRMPVVQQEREAGGGDDHREAAHQLLAFEQGDDRQRAGDDRRDHPARGVHVVEEVERVGDHHDPYHRDDGVDGVAEQAGLGAGGHRDRRGRDLDEEPDGGPNGSHVVDETDDPHHDRAGEDRGGLRLPFGEGKEKATAPSAMATPPRYGVGVVCAFPAAGWSVIPLASAKRRGERNQRRDDDERDASGEHDAGHGFLGNRMDTGFGTLRSGGPTGFGAARPTVLGRRVRGRHHTTVWPAVVTLCGQESPTLCPTSPTPPHTTATAPPSSPTSARGRWTETEPAWMALRGARPRRTRSRSATWPPTIRRPTGRRAVSAVHHSSTPSSISVSRRCARATSRRRTLNAGETFYPLHAYVCGQCFLVQLEQYVSAEDIFRDYAYFSSYSDSWLAHAKAYVEMITARLRLHQQSLVVELASNDGYLLQYFAEYGIPVLGIEPAENVAKDAVERGVETLTEFFTVELANQLVARRHPRRPGDRQQRVGPGPRPQRLRRRRQACC